MSQTVRKKSAAGLVSVFVALIFATFLCRPVLAEPNNLVGKALPAFSVSSGDDKVYNLAMTRGKLTVIFYESRYAVKKNEPFKELLKVFFLQQPEEMRRQVVRLPVIDCSSAYLPIRHFWKKSLVEHSKIEGLTIYGDWDGKMRKDFGLKDGDTNFMVVDKNGMIRFFTTGKISEDSYDGIKSLLLRLVSTSS